MMAVLLTTLFTATALLAAMTIAANWRRYGRTALALRGQAAACSDWREVRVTIKAVTVHSTATVLRPQFRTANPRPSQPTALPAAA